MPTQTMISVEEYLASSYEPDCDYIDGRLEERCVGEWDHATLQGKILIYLQTRHGKLGIRAVPELRLRVAAARFRIPDICVFLKDPGERVPSTPPFLCIEILSPEDRMSRIEKRISDYLVMGVPYVWVLDPETRQAYTATPEEGLRESKSGRLRTEDPALEVPLAEMWAQ